MRRTMCNLTTFRTKMCNDPALAFLLCNGNIYPDLVEFSLSLNAADEQGMLGEKLYPIASTDAISMALTLNIAQLCLRACI